MDKINRFFKTSSARQALIVLVFITSLLFISILLGNFTKEIDRQQRELGSQRLEGVALQGCNYIDNTFKDYINYIDSIAKAMAGRDNLTSPENLRFLNFMSKSTAFERLAFDFADGTSYTSDGHVFDIKDLNYTQRIQDKKTFITDLFYAKVDSQPTVSIISPIIKDGKAIAAVRGTLYTRNLNNIINADFFDGSGYFYLIDSKGNILARPHSRNVLFPDSGNFFLTAKSLNFVNNYTLEQIIDDIQHGRSGTSAYTYGEHSRYTYYMPVGINDWSIFVAIPTMAIDSSAAAIKNTTASLLGKISLILLIAFSIVIYIMTRSRKEVEQVNEQFEVMTAVIPGGIIITDASGDFAAEYVSLGYYELTGYSKEEFANKFDNKGLSTLHPHDRKKALLSIKRQIADSGTFSMSVRVWHKTKNYIWVHLQGRLHKVDYQNKLYMVAVDISKQLDTLKQLEEEKSFNKIISSLSDDGFFDYDNLNKTIRYSKNFAERLGISEMLENYPESALATGVIADDSRHLYTADRFNSPSAELIEEEAHFQLADGQELWYLLRYNIIFDEHGLPVRAIGKMTDITKKNVHISHLQDQTQKDPLTELYNKTATEDIISQTLAQATPEQRFALLIIDIDNFKGINDNFGHLYGDKFLKNFAQTLKSLFRADDVVGRIGGDEFFVFLKNFSSEEVIRTKAKKMCKVFKNVQQKNNIKLETSVSIGIAVYPRHGLDFSTLYNNADSALYEAKRNGKNNFNFYGEKLFTRESSLTELLRSQGTTCNLSLAQGISYTSNSFTAIATYIQDIIEDFGFSRGYILHKQDDSYVKVFECFASNLAPAYAGLEASTPYTDISKHLEEIALKGVVIYNHAALDSHFLISLASEIGSKTIVHFAIMKNDQVQGVIGFDDYREARIFTEREFYDLSCVCKLISTFILTIYTQSDRTDKL